MNAIAPCKGCTLRVLGCHSTCERYQEFKRQREEANEARARALRLEGALKRRRLATMRGAKRQ